MMEIKKSVQVWVVLAFLVLAIGQPPLGAQEAAGQVEENADTPPEQQVDIEEIIMAEEEMLAGKGYAYEAGNRRDPFKSLLAARDRPAFRGPRPEGIPGLLIGEVDLTGIFIMSDGPAAQLQSSDQDRSYLLRVGDQLYDGDVVSISATEIVFKQMVNDPTALKPFREVVKKLEP